MSKLDTRLSKLEALSPAQPQIERDLSRLDDTDLGRLEAIMLKLDGERHGTAS